MFTIEYSVLGNYREFSRKDSLRSAKREAKNLNYYGGWLSIRIITPEGKTIQYLGE